MSSHTLFLNHALYTYLLQYSLREPSILKELREATASLPGAKMQLSPEQGQLMRLLLELMGAKKGLEIGVYTGYSTLSMALALPHDGQIIACDISDQFTNIAQKFWEKAGIAHQIDLRIAPALTTLAHLTTHEANSFDFAFIDADKKNYDNYYEQCLILLRPGGLIIIDNVFWGGKVAELVQDETTSAINNLNKKIFQDARVTFSMLPLGDGVTLIRKQ